jgi:hypothetical protein
MALIRFENQDKFFVKFFLLDASLNLNRWGVTRQSLEANLETFVGKPFVLTPKFDHPSAQDGDDLLVQQERYRVGNIIMVGIEQRTGKAWGVAEITDNNARDVIKNGEVNFVSPSIVFNNSDEQDVHGNSVIEHFEGAHVAGVAEPAYHIDKAQIKGRCSGSEGECVKQLQKVEASVSPCGKYANVETPNKLIAMAGAECVKKCIDAKVAEGKTIDEQALAICYSECYDSKEGNIDPQSLDNITKVEMLKKKKKEADNGGEVTSKNKVVKKIPDDDEEKANNTSLKSKQSEKVNNMKSKYAEEKSEDKDEAKKAEDLSNEEEKRFDEEITKAKAKKAEHDDDEDHEDADDENKLDLTDRQEEYLKDKKESKLASQVRILKSEVKSLKSQIRRARVEPIIDSILDAKSKLGTLKSAEAEYNKLIKLDSDTLESLKADYDKLAEGSTSPRFEVKYASVEKGSADAIMQRIREGGSY